MVLMSSRIADFAVNVCPMRMSVTRVLSCQVYDVACGYGFTLFAAKHNRKHVVLGTGINTDSQLGYHEYPRNSGNSADVMWCNDVMWYYDVMWCYDVMWSNDVMWSKDLLDHPRNSGNSADVMWCNDVMWCYNVMWSIDVMWSDDLSWVP